MRMHHGRRGGCVFTGILIGAMSLSTSAGGNIPDPVAAPAAHRTGVTVVERDAGAQAAPVSTVPAAPRAVPVAVPEDATEPVSEPEPERPVIQAGPGPATPVEGATTLIDPLVIEREAPDVTE